MPVDAGLLKQIPLLRDFSEEALVGLASGALERKVVRREVVVKRGDALQFFPFLLDGRLQGVDFTLDGREVGLYFVGPGEFFAEMAVIDRLPMAETVIALSPSSLLLFPRSRRAR